MTKRKMTKAIPERELRRMSNGLTALTDICAVGEWFSLLRERGEELDVLYEAAKEFVMRYEEYDVGCGEHIRGEDNIERDVAQDVQSASDISGSLRG